MGIRCFLLSMADSKYLINICYIKLGIKIKIALEVQTIFNLARAVSETNFLACVGKKIAEELKEKFPIQIRTIPLSIPELRIALYWHERTHRQHSHIWFKKLIEEEMRAISQ